MLKPRGKLLLFILLLGLSQALRAQQSMDSLPAPRILQPWMLSQIDCDFDQWTSNCSKFYAQEGKKIPKKLQEQIRQRQEEIAHANSYVDSLYYAYALMARDQDHDQALAMKYIGKSLQHNPYYFPSILLLSQYICDPAKPSQECLSFIKTNLIKLHWKTQMQNLALKTYYQGLEYMEELNREHLYSDLIDYYPVFKASFPQEYHLAYNPSSEKDLLQKAHTGVYLSLLTVADKAKQSHMPDLEDQYLKLAKDYLLANLDISIYQDFLSQENIKQGVNNQGSSTDLERLSQVEKDLAQAKPISKPNLTQLIDNAQISQNSSLSYAEKKPLNNATSKKLEALYPQLSLNLYYGQDQEALNTCLIIDSLFSIYRFNTPASYDSNRYLCFKCNWDKLTSRAKYRLCLNDFSRADSLYQSALKLEKIWKLTPEQSLDCQQKMEAFARAKKQIIQEYYGSIANKDYLSALKELKDGNAAKAKISIDSAIIIRQNRLELRDSLKNLAYDQLRQKILIADQYDKLITSSYYKLYNQMDSIAYINQYLVAENYYKTENISAFYLAHQGLLKKLYLQKEGKLLLIWLDLALNADLIDQSQAILDRLQELNYDKKALKPFQKRLNRKLKE